MKTDFSGNYLNTTNAAEGDFIEVASEGEVSSIDVKGKKPGEMYTKTVYNIPVMINGDTKIWTPSNEDGKKWTVKYGSDTINWVGKRGAVSHVKYKSFGETKTAIAIDPVN